MMQCELINCQAQDFLKIEQSRKYDFVYIDPPFFCQRNFGEFQDSWDSIDDYMQMLVPTFIEAKRVLKDTGNICVHVDWHASHHVRLALDCIFGYQNFRNEIIWCYNSGGASKRHLARKHDNLFVYCKNPELSKFNVLREPYPNDYGGRDGFHPEGRMLNDWWQIGIISSTASERNGYPTQKPIQLLERLINIYTDKDDLVLDFFCGSGTTLHAALNLGRSAVGVDKNHNAIEISRKRLADASYGQFLI